MQKRRNKLNVSMWGLLLGGVFSAGKKVKCEMAWKMVKPGELGAV